MVFDESGKERLSVIIVDDNHDFVYVVEECLHRDGFEVIGKAHDGETAVKEIINKKPDIVLLDVVMPLMSGISVLEHLRENQIRPLPVIIMITAVGQDKYIRKALSLGAEYYILKPYDIALLPGRIKQIYEDSGKSEKNGKKENKGLPGRPIKMGLCLSGEITAEKAEEEVTKVLHDIGVPTCLAGYDYLKKAIVETVLSEQGFIPVTKTLYPLIADAFDTSPGKVEREIRGAIQKVWQRMNKQNLSKYFCRIGYYKGVRPTNSEFIATIADKIRLMYRIR